MLAWGNINMFDYRNSLLTGKVSLTLWTVPKGMDALLNHLGTTGMTSLQNLRLKFKKS